MNHTTHTATSFTVNLESSYDWQGSEWTIPANFMVSQILKVGSQILSVQLSYRTYTERPQDGPDWGLRLAIVLLFPKLLRCAASVWPC